MNDDDDAKLNERDIDYYFRLLMALDALLWHLREALKAHEDCEGCSLCLTCEGIEFTIDHYNDILTADAPGEALRRFNREFEDLQLTTNPEPQQPKPTIVAAKPDTATKSKPYWIP